MYFPTWAWTVHHPLDSISPQRLKARSDLHPHLEWKDEGCSLKYHILCQFFYILQTHTFLSETESSLGPPTCTEVSSWSPRLRLEQHTLGRHFCCEGSLDVINKSFTVRAVHPDTLTERVLNVDLGNTTMTTHQYHDYCEIRKLDSLTTYFDKYLRPVFILLIGSHQ